MMGTTHMAGGAVGWLAASVALHAPPVVAAGGAAIAAGAALVPDIDTRGSRISRRLPLVSWVVRHLPGGDHRHLTHSIFGFTLWAAGCAAVTALVLRHHDPYAAFPWWVVLAALLLGYAAHIAWDMFTVTGCPLFWPSLHAFWLMPVRDCRCHTGLDRKKIKGKGGGRKIHTGEFWFYAPATWLTAGVLAAAYVLEVGRLHLHG